MRMFLTPSLRSYEGVEIESCTKIAIGFPKRAVTETPTTCACHGVSNYASHYCPGCQTPSCELNTTCKVCGLYLVSSAKLARTSQQQLSQGLKTFVPIGEFLGADGT